MLGTVEGQGGHLPNLHVFSWLGISIDSDGDSDGDDNADADADVRRIRGRAPSCRWRYGIQLWVSAGCG